jgi:transcription initiation factor TFIID TATA-box-binding protein
MQENTETEILSMPIQPRYTYKIENVVATVTTEITERMDLNQIAAKYIDVDYNPERFPGLIMRVKDPKATILVFTTGKMVITGMREETEAGIVVERVMKKILDSKIQISNPKIIIQNIVASGDLKCSIDLNMAAVVMQYSMYEPEVFPGLIYRMQDPKTVFLIFSTGRVVCTGGKSANIVAKAIKNLFYSVRDYGITREPGEIHGNDDDEEMMLI